MSQDNDKSTMNGKWCLKVEADQPVVYLNFFWKSEDSSSKIVNLDIVAVAQAQSLYLAFLEIPISQTITKNQWYKIRIPYKWGAFLKKDHVHMSNVYISEANARAAFEEGISLSRFVVTHVEFSED
ncbi:MAG: hypothetical protein ACWA5R_10620 [bacterium]